MAYAGCILPLYHGNGAETDLKSVGDIAERLISRRFIPAPGKFALARMLQMQLRLGQTIVIKQEITELIHFGCIPAHPFSTICCHGDAAKPRKTGIRL
jgi:hypothetical protein